VTREAGRASPAVTLALCFAAAMVEGFDIQAAGVAARGMGAAFALDPGELGLVLAASPLGLLFGAALGGRLADRVGRKGSLIASVAVFGLFTLGTALSSGGEALLVMRFLTGLGLGGALPNLIALSAEAAARRNRTTLVAVMAAGMPVGGVLAALTGLASGDWRGVFWIGGAAPLALAALLWLALPESRRFQEAKAAGATRVPLAEALFGQGRALTTLLLGAAFFATLLILYLLQNWLPSLMQDRGFSRPQAAAIQAAFNVGGAAGAMALGWLIDRGARRWVIAGAYAGAAASLLALAAIGSDLTQAALTAGMVGVFVTGSQLALYGLAPHHYATAIRGTGVGAAVALGRAGAVSGPLFAAALVGAGEGAAEVLRALLPVVVVAGAAAVAVTFRPRVDD
jgi:AAHS family 3-hydroxyphenylpropionic acid transporter